MEGRLCFVFYSSLKNLKEVYICAVEGHTAPVRGQVRRSQSLSPVYDDIVLILIFSIRDSYQQLLQTTNLFINTSVF